MDPAPVRVAAELRAFGLQNPVIELPPQLNSTGELSAALAVEPEQIVQCRVAAARQAPILVMVGGDSPIGWPYLERRLRGSLREAPADEVLRLTGCPAGLVAPVGWPDPPLAYLDERLLEFDYVYASAGAPGRLIGLPPLELARITSADIVDLTG